MSQEMPPSLYLSPSSDTDLSAQADGSVSLVTLSDYLPLLSEEEAKRTLDNCARVLTDTGHLCIRIPDFVALSTCTNEGNAKSVQELLLGSDGRQRKTFWSETGVRELLYASGWSVVEIQRDETGWVKIVAINRRMKQWQRPLRDIQACMTMPRLAWTDNIDCCFTTCFTLGINMTRSTGAFWGQGLTRALKQHVGNPDIKYILTIDYDTIFDANDVVRLYQIMETHPEYFALCPTQIHREKMSVLMTLDDGNGVARKEVEYSETLTDVLPIITGNFGLTLIRTDMLRRLPEPWFIGTPNKDGCWEDGKIDDDIHFWIHARKAGLKIGVAPQVRVGHLQMVCTWPNRHMALEWQYMSDYKKNGRRESCKTL